MYQFYPQLLLRTPAYSYEKYGNANLQKFLSDSYFRSAVQLASAGFFGELEKRNFEASKLTPGMRHTLQKYLNRMCFRPTPFGLFSGFSVVSWSAEQKNPLLLDNRRARVHMSPSFSKTLRYARELLDHELAPYHTYLCNDSLYRVGDEYRYVRYVEETDGRSRKFIIDSCRYEPLLHAILQFCETDRSRKAVVAFIIEQAAATAAESEEFLEELVAQQLLVSTLAPTITGDDYLERLLHLCRTLKLDTPRTRALAQLPGMFASGIVAGSSGRRGAATKERAPVLPAPGKTDAALYVNLDKGAVSGGLNVSYQEAILQGLACLGRLLPPSVPPGLQHFVTAFRQRFENRSIPLMIALDPETGVGYEALAGSYGEPTLLETVEFPAKEQAQPTVAWTGAHALFMEKWPASRVVELTDEDLDNISSREDTPAFSPSISVMFRVMPGEQVYLEQAGGASATALLGRFTPLHAEIEEMARTLAACESAANPGVHFAEIAHLCDTHTANIDRRRSIRDFEIPVVVSSSMRPEQQIPLSDLWVRVEGGKVVLFSQRLGKAIVPRLASAFNYMRNDLSVFRFLCDLQYQGIQANFTLDLSHFFPGMRFYPRVVYKSAVLHLAAWHLRKEEVDAVTAAPAALGAERLRTLADKLGWPRRIALTEHDHQLVFDLENEAELTLLLQTMRHKEKVVIQEYPFAGEQAPLVADRESRPYTHQFLAALYHRQEVYPVHDLPLSALAKENEAKRKVLPGSGWLYLKIYCHPSRSNQLLVEVLLPVIRQLLRTGDVRQWFFIRYRDPGYHLRVRIAVSEESAGNVLQVFNRKLAGRVRNGTVQDFQVAVYERELERYGSRLMEAVEDVFCASSSLVAATIRRQAADETDLGYYAEAFRGLNVIADAFGLPLTEKAAFFQQLYQGFYREFSGDRKLREQLSRKYRELSRVPGLMPGAGPGEEQDRRLGSLKKRHREVLRAIAEKKLPAGQRRQLVADLMHMHLNRLLVDEARKQELVVYYCLWKCYVAAQARAEA